MSEKNKLFTLTPTKPTPPQVNEFADIEARLSEAETRIQTRRAVINQILEKVEALEQKDAELDNLEKKALELLIQRLERM